MKDFRFSDWKVEIELLIASGIATVAFSLIFTFV